MPITTDLKKETIPCAVCGRPSTADDYDDREDMPSCGSVTCELRMQAFLDHSEDVGNR